MSSLINFNVQNKLEKKLFENGMQDFVICVYLSNYTV